MNSWILSIIGIILLTSIATIIMPEGKIGGFIKGIFAILSMIVIVQPVLNLYSVDFNLENVFSDYEIELQSDYLFFMSDKKVEEYEKGCKKILSELGFGEANVDIDAELINDNLIVKKVLVNLSDSVIKGEFSHIVILTSLKKAISDYLNVEEELIFVYE